MGYAGQMRLLPWNPRGRTMYQPLYQPSAPHPWIPKGTVRMTMESQCNSTTEAEIYRPGKGLAMDMQSPIKGAEPFATGFAVARIQQIQTPWTSQSQAGRPERCRSEAVPNAFAQVQAVQEETLDSFSVPLCPVLHALRRALTARLEGASGQKGPESRDLCKPGSAWL